MKRETFQLSQGNVFSCFSFSFQSDPFNAKRTTQMYFVRWSRFTYTCKPQGFEIAKSENPIELDEKRVFHSGFVHELNLFRLAKKKTTKRWKKIEKENLLRYHWRVDVCSLNLFDLVLIWFDSVPVNRFTYMPYAICPSFSYNRRKITISFANERKIDSVIFSSSVDQFMKN